jgi:2-iminobutanoate/2-iminopropanoate deaminase
MKRRVISAGPKPIGNLPLSPAVCAGPLVFVSGQVAVAPETSQFTGGDAVAQTHQVMKNLQQLLAVAGSSLDRVVKVTAYLTDIADFPAFNDAYRSYFASEPPARSTVQVARLVGPYSVEIDVIALIGEEPE